MYLQFSTRTDHPYPVFFFFNDTATTEIYTLSLHDALPISTAFAVVLVVGSTAVFTSARLRGGSDGQPSPTPVSPTPVQPDRKSTRLNSSHGYISYAVFCLKKKKKTHHHLSLTCYLRRIIAT